MLRAEQAALEQHGKAELLRILEREFQYYKSSFDSVGTQAALMAGFSITVLVTLETADTKPLFVVRCYHISSFVCLMSLIYTVVSVTTVVVWGPQLALRGSSPTAMETAVRGVKAARYGIYISFVLGVITFLLMTVTVSWIQMDDDVAAICSACAFLTLILILRNGYSTKMTFSMIEHAAASNISGSVRNSTYNSVPSSGYSGTRDSSGLSTTDVAQYQQNQQLRNRMNKSALLEDDDTQSNGSFAIRRSSASSFISTTPSSSGNNTNNQSAHAAAMNAKNNSNSLHEPLVSSSTVNRESNISAGDNVDGITTQLLLNGGGWLMKKGYRFGGDAWKKRWVTIHRGALYYDKSRLPRQSETPSSTINAKKVSLASVSLGMGSDGKTIRLTSSSNSTMSANSGTSSHENEPLVTDWRCETQEERDAWILYIKSGINQTTKI